MKRQLEGKPVVITGASGGIGAAVAHRLYARGAYVIIAARSTDKLHQLSAELGSRAIPMQLDVTDDRSVAETFALIEREYGAIEVLINNAGFGLFETVADSPLSSFEQMMNVNYLGLVRCTKEALPAMLAAKSGHIINIASIASKFATAKSAAYSGTKYAVLGFTNVLRQELQGTGVAVTAIHPGPVDTSFFAIADPSGGYVRNVRRFMVTPERVARAIEHAIDSRKAEIHIPGWMGLGATIAQTLPISLVNQVAARFLKLK